MANQIKTLESGAVLELQMASFEKAHKLLKAVSSEIQQVNIDLGMNVDLKAMFSRGQDGVEINSQMMNTLKNFLAKIISSDVVDEALWPCMATALYNKNKITRDTFDAEEARCDFLVVTQEVLVYNLAPFFKNLGSLLSGIGQKNTDAQKQA